jgi:hypothetical protein
MARPFIFIHNCKTGGTSVRAALRRFEPFPIRFYKSLLPRLNRFYEIRHPAARAHSSCKDWLEWLGEEEYQKYYKFAFCRNPYSLNVSLFFYIRSYPQHHLYKAVAKLSFESFCRWRVRRGPILQKDMVTDNGGRVIADFIGRYESLERDFSDVLRQLDIRSTKLPRLNDSPHDDYRVYYSDECASLIRDAYAEDFTFFNYDQSL